MIARVARLISAPSSIGGALAIAPPRADIASGANSLTNLQALRGAAAAGVLLHHAGVYLQSLRGVPRPYPALDALFALMGVAVFFAISGYLMAGLVRRDDPWRFLAHRIARIVPTYLAVVALFALIFAVLRISFSLNLPALSLAPTVSETYPLNVEWTLVFETSFYVGLFVLALWGAAARIVSIALVWLAVLAVAWFVLPASDRASTLPPLHLLPLSACCVPFAGGLLLPRAIERGWVRPAVAWLAVPLVAAILILGTEAGRWLGGIAAVCLVGAMVSARQLDRTGLLGRLAVPFGNWSYALYLVHVPVILLVAHFAPVTWPPAALVAAALLVPLGVAALLGPLDMALYRRLRRWVDTTTARRRIAAVAVYLAVFAGFSAHGMVKSIREQAAWQRVMAALDALPREAWTSTEAANAAVAARGLTLAASVRSGIDGIERVGPTKAILGAWAIDLEHADHELALAIICSGDIVGYDRPRRMRPDVAVRPEFEAAQGKRVGYRLRFASNACAPGTSIVPVLIGRDGRMKALPERAAPG